MIAQEPVVKGWAVSTESKIKQLIDDFIINYPQANVRKTTSRLLTSLFKKGSEAQRSNVIQLLIERVQLLSSMGKSSEQFLSLINKIFDLFPQHYIPEKIIIFNQVWARTKEIFNKITSNKEYQFYSLSSNMIDFGQQFKPYLLQANGCLKCFGRPDVEFQQTNINNIRQQLRVHLNSTQWVLKRIYEINNFQMNFIKKKVSFKSMTLYYYDEDGVKRQLGKFTPNDNIPSYNLTTNTIGINFEFSKIRRSHISCIICSSNEEYASLCTSCIGKLIEMQGNVKVVGGNPQKINKQLSDSFKTMNQLRTQLEQFSFCVTNQSKITPLRSKIISQMENSYTNIIQNLKLLRNLSQNELKAEKDKFSLYTTDCYSCHFFEFTACINFIFQTLKKPIFKVDLSQIMSLIQDFKSIFFHNKIKDLNSRLSSIVSQLFNRVLSIDYLNQLPIQKANSHLIVRLLVNLVEHLKVSHKANSQLLQDLKNYVFNSNINRFFTIKQKIELFVILQLNEEYYYLLSDNSLEIQKLQDLKRLSIEQYEKYKNLLNFNIQEMFTLNISNIIKIFLVLLPEELIPESRLDIADPTYLKFIKNVPPVITDQFIFSNIVFTPNPILKLNIFKLLPQLIQLLPLEESIELIKTLCKYKPLWNTYIIEAVNRFDNILEGVEKERRMMLCLEGYDASKQNLYFQHIYKMLTPQRTNFIIRLQIPQKEMQKQQKNKGGPVEYIYLPIREVKSQDLKSDTIGGLHQWITEQIRKLGQDMPFDLIVENNIIDNLDLSLEIIYKKIVQKQAKRQIGNKNYDFFKVIYRIQGIFGEANERISGNPRDQKYEECINFSTHLLTKLPIKKTGLDILMEIIPTLEKQSKDKKDKFIKILGIVFKYESIIKKIVEWGYGNYILNMAVKNISLTKQQLRSTEMLLQMCSKIIDEANLQMVKIRKNSGAFSGRKFSQGDMDIQGDNQQSQKAVQFVLQRVKEAQQSGFKHISKKLIKILPFCSKDDMLASRYLFQYFEVNKIFEIKYSQKLSWLLEFIHALSESYSSFKSICKQEGVTNKMVEIISSGLKILEIQKIKENIDLLELCFSLCKGLIQGDMHLQQVLFQKQILQQIYKITGFSQGGLTEQRRSKLGKIPLICFQIIKYFQQGKIINHQVHQFFVKIEQEKKKSNKLKNIKMKKQIFSKNKQIIDKYRSLMVEQDQKLGCSSCKFGYKHKKQVLGVYLYSTKVQILQLENWWKDNKKTQNITSTSYFEPIHLQCHIQAMKDDLKLQKTEWDGALVRNSDVLCNNWCPFKGPQTTDEQFDRALKKYFEKNNKNLSFWIALNDLNGLLERFSKEYNFALEIKGSSYTHNAKLIPVMISIVSHLLKNNEDMKYLKEGIFFIESNQTKKPNLVYLYFTLFLFTTTYTTFNSKKAFCLKLIENLGYGHFKDSKAFYIQLGLIKSIMRVTHSNLNQGVDVLAHLNNFIPKNFINLIQSFLLIAEQYKSVMLRWQNVEQAKLYFEQP